MMIWPRCGMIAHGLRNQQRWQGNRPVELLSFFKEYLASPKYVGTIAPSSRLLAETITDAAGVRQASSVVEFGPGTGVFTEVIARKIPNDATFIAIELSEDFVKTVRKKCPTAQVFHGSAVDARRFIESVGLKYCDCIVSGLPFALFEDDLQAKILDAAVDILKPGGVFTTFTYFFSPSLPAGKKLLHNIEARFSRVERTPTVWLNLFPAFAYRAIK